MAGDPSHCVKVLICIEHYLPGWRAGGPLRSVASMVERLGNQIEFSIVTRNHDCGVVEPYRGIKAGFWEQVGKARVLYCAGGELSLRRLLHMANEVAPDVVYLNSAFAPMGRKLLMLRRAGLLDEMGFVLAPRGEFSPGALQLKHNKKKAFLAMASVAELYRELIWQASSTAEEKDIKAAMGTNCQIHIAPNLASRSRLQNVDVADRPEKVAGSARFVFISRITPKKNLSQAVQLLGDLNGEVSLDIYGPIEDEVYWRKCQDLISGLPANIEVIYRGTLFPADVASTLGNYHFFFFPTLGENFGHVILEALSAGCPVLLSDQTPWRSLTKKGAGWDLALSDTQRWRTTLNKCVEMNCTAYHRLSHGASELARQWLSGNESEAQHIALFNHAAEGARIPLTTSGGV